MTNAHRSTRALSLFLIILTASLAGLSLLAGFALADDMGGMSGMSQQDMQAMTPTPTPAATDATTMNMTADEMAGMDMDKGSVNWFVIGGFIAIIGGATIAAVAIKGNLRRKALAGELAGAGKQDV